MRPVCPRAADCAFCASSRTICDGSRRSWRGISPRPGSRCSRASVSRSLPKSAFPSSPPARFGTRRGSVCNLSVVGVYVALGEIPAPGTRGRIAFRLPRSESEFATDFKVTWQNPDVPNRMLALPPGCGLHFENLGAREEELLSDIVNEYQHAIAG